MYVLGVHDGHNSTACLLKDGEIVSCVSEERFTRVKNQRGFPALSVEWCLKNEQITGSDLDRVALSTLHDPLVDIADPSTVQRRSQRLLMKASRIERALPRRWGTSLWQLYRSTAGPRHLRDRLRLISKTLGVRSEKIDVVEHHTAHAYAAYFGAPFRGDTLIVTLDGEGDGLCATVSLVEGDSLRRVASTKYPNSLGWIYLAATQFLGMKANEHEYKVMGLAPYASATDVQKVYDKLSGLLRVEGLEFASPINTRYAFDWMKEHCIGQRFDWVAGAVQRLSEEVISTWVTNLARAYGLKRFAFAGGVFMNVKANMILSQLPYVDEMFVLPSCGDESLPIGAAFFSYASMKRQCGEKVDISPLKSLYWGPSYPVEEKTLRDLCRDHNLAIEHYSNIEGKIAELLIDRKIVARLAGKMEWGARALGNRSILGRADDSSVVELLNRMIKQRDFWMPFAPVILDEREQDYVVNPKHVDAPYMIMAFPSTELGQNHLKAAMHPADKTLRPQILRDEWNPRYHKILKEVEQHVGLGGLVNTSFNLHGEPIVCSPEDAVSTLIRSGLEYLAVEDYLIRKL